MYEASSGRKGCGPGDELEEGDSLQCLGPTEFLGKEWARRDLGGTLR